MTRGQARKNLLACPSLAPTFLVSCRAMRASWTARLGAEDAAAYDAFVAKSPSGHAFQTRAWAPVLGAGTFSSARWVLVRDGARLVGTALLSRPCALGLPLPWARIERGPVVGDPAVLGACLRAIERAALARGVSRLNVMPYWTNDQAELAERELALHGYGDVQTAAGAHARTLRVSLRGDVSSVMAGAPLGQARWRHGQAQRAGATARSGTRADWPTLRRMHVALMREQGRRSRSDSWWEALQAFASDDGRGSLFVSEHEGRVVSACVCLRHEGLVTYTWGASVRDHLPFTKAIPALVAAVRWAHGLGCDAFDLGGIPLAGDIDPKRTAIAKPKYDFSREPVRLVREHARWLVPR